MKFHKTCLGLCFLNGKDRHSIDCVIFKEGSLDAPPDHFRWGKKNDEKQRLKYIKNKLLGLFG